MNRSINLTKTTKTIGLLAAGLLLGWLIFGGSSEMQTGVDQHIEEAHTDAEGNIVYTCSMHPDVRKNEPGNCPICGMELIPVGDSGMEEESRYTLTMTEEAIKLAEIQTTTVAEQTAVKEIRLPGKITVDERRLGSLPAHFPGRIEQLYVNFTGEYVEEGQKVASVYSPELVSAQKELLEASDHKAQNPTLYEAARNKLKNWKIPDAYIEQIEQTGEIQTSFDIVSNLEGYVIKRNIAVGDHIYVGSVMYKLADLSKVWIVFDAFERDLAGLDVDDTITFTVDAYPGESFQASVTYIDPTIDPQKRTVSVRAETDNPGGLLKPQMLVEGIVKTRLYGGEQQVLVPKSAVLWTGERSVVYIRKPNMDKPTFEFREVVLGPQAGNYYVVKSGVHPGEEVVTNGNFKIDSAAQLSGKASMMNRDPSGKKQPMQEGHQH